MEPGSLNGESSVCVSKICPPPFHQFIHTLSDGVNVSWHGHCQFSCATPYFLLWNFYCRAVGLVNSRETGGHLQGGQQQDSHSTAESDGQLGVDLAAVGRGSQLPSLVDLAAGSRLGAAESLPVVNGSAQPEVGDNNKEPSDSATRTELKTKVACKDTGGQAQFRSDESSKLAAQSHDTKDSGEACSETMEPPPTLFFFFSIPFLKLLFSAPSLSVSLANAFFH